MFDIYAAPGLGTAVLAEFWRREKTNPHAAPLDVGVESIPIHGETVCGDGWGARKLADSMLLMVVDGLGHGILASDAAREAEAIFAAARTPRQPPFCKTRTTRSGKLGALRWP